MKTIDIINKDDCYGCGACFNICPVNAIEMKKDPKEFLVPVINEEKCIKCGKCYNVCPALEAKSMLSKDMPECYAVWAEDDIREKSSSGGMFSLMANYILENNGYVCGAAYAPDCLTVHHIIINSKDDLDKLRTSKYVQSDTENVYKDIYELLENGKLVLFSGCPCQIAGLYKFLGKDYDNLYTTDLICHGANSPKAYRAYIKQFAGDKKVKRVNFRNKEIYGWSTTFEMETEDNKIIRRSFKESSYYKAFLDGLINRKKCSTCEFANRKRVGNITIGDFWGITQYYPELKKLNGVSVALINNNKGKIFFESICKNAKGYKKIDYTKAYMHNSQLKSPTRAHKYREIFFEYIDKYSFDAALQRIRGDKFDIGIIGWWYNSNYGSIITYFALKKLLEKLDFYCIMIDSLSNNKVPKYSSINNIGRRFARKQGYRISKRYNQDNIAVLNNHCETFVVGSDQMWGRIFKGNRESNPAYYLNFAWSNKKKVAIGVSFGDEKYVSKAKNNLYEKYVKSFDAVSVRERYGVNMASYYYNVNATHIFDPVFLCERQCYYEVAKASKYFQKTEPYMLCYILDPSERINENIKYISQKTGLKVKVILDASENNFLKNKNKMLDFDVIQAEEEDWLALILNSSLVVTDSYHGTCMSIIFEKEFISLINESRGRGRFDDLLSLLNLENRAVENNATVKCISQVLENKTDYKEVYKILEGKKHKDIEWVKSSLNIYKPERITQEDELRLKTYNLEERIKKLENNLYSGDFITVKKRILSIANIRKFNRIAKKEGFRSAFYRVRLKLKAQKEEHNNV